MEIPHQIHEAMVAHARFCYPEEACGLLAAEERGELRMVYCLTNAEHSPTTYTVDPTEHFKALRHAERQGWELVGAFHSHTHSVPYPSPTDRTMALEPDWVYLIVGLADLRKPQVRGYFIRDGQVSEEQLVVSESQDRRRSTR